MESYKPCEAKSGYVWNMMMYTGQDTEPVNYVGGVDVRNFTKPSRIVLTLSEKLLNKGYLIGLDNYYSSPELYEFLNLLETDALGTVRSNRKDLPKFLMTKKFKMGEVAAAFRNMLTTLKWKGKRDVCVLSSIYDASTKTVRDSNMIKPD